MISLVFSTPILAYDERNTQLATVGEALALIRSERFDPYRYTKSGTERPAWTDAVQALTTAQTKMTPEATALARGATVRLLACGPISGPAGPAAVERLAACPSALEPRVAALRRSQSRKLQPRRLCICLGRPGTASGSDA